MLGFIQRIYTHFRPARPTVIYATSPKYGLHLMERGEHRDFTEGSAASAAHSLSKRTGGRMTFTTRRLNDGQTRVTRIR